jgi:anthranilate phosphoribosyltransferase
MAGNATEAEIAGVLIALRTKGETEDELAGPRGHDAGAGPRRSPRAATTWWTPRGRAAGAHVQRLDHAALIAAGAGCAVAKHGNRSATGLSGSADVLEALGARITLPPAMVARCIDEAGLRLHVRPGPPRGHPLRRPVRKALAVRTIFNVLGPLTNPAGPGASSSGSRIPRCSTSWRERSRAWASTARW